MRKKICVFIGSRANYSSLIPIINYIKKSRKLKLQIMVGASAILEKYGDIRELLNKNGHKNYDEVNFLIEGTSLNSMAQSAGLGIIEISNCLKRLKPDALLIVGDRFEMLSAAIAASYMNIHIIHTMGGEISGSIDESIRHAITKLAHIHFPANEDAKNRIIKLGEDPKFIFNFGCPRLDTIKKSIVKNNNNYIQDILNKEGVGSKIDFKLPYILVLQHPVTTEFHNNILNINKTLKAISNIDIQKIILWPNSDAGSDQISQQLRKFKENKYLENIRFFKNFDFEIFSKLLFKASCVVGNSSSGIRDCSFLGTPVVDIGTRQKNRKKFKNVITVDNNSDHIYKAIIKQIKKRYPRSYIYGKGDSGLRIVKKLENIIFPSIQKKFFD